MCFGPISVPSVKDKATYLENVIKIGNFIRNLSCQLYDSSMDFFIKIIVNVITCADAILKIICSLTIRINVIKNYIGLCKNESTTKLSIDVTCILCKQNERIESSQFLFKQNSRIMLEKANMTCWGNLRFFSFLLTKV